MMPALICQQCRSSLDPLTAKVEWLSTMHNTCLVETIRIVHPHCQYEYSHPNTQKMMRLYDHWLPFWTLKDFMEIVDEMEWDNKPVALDIFKDYIHHQQQRAQEAQNENNRT